MADFEHFQGGFRRYFGPRLVELDGTQEPREIVRTLGRNGVHMATATYAEIRNSQSFPRNAEGFLIAYAAMRAPEEPARTVLHDDLSHRLGYDILVGRLGVSLTLMMMPAAREFVDPADIPSPADEQ